MTPIAPSESVKPPEAQLFNKDEAIKELSTENIAEPFKYETPTYLSNNKVEGGGNNKNEGFYISKKMMKIGGIALAAIFLGGGAFFGIKAANNGNNAGETGLGGGEPTENSSTNPAETSGTEATTVDSESLVVTVAPSETSEQTGTSETLVNNNPEIYSNIEYLPQTMSVEEMKAISTLEEWANVSPANRAAYFILTNEAGYTGHTAEDINNWTTKKSFFDSLKFYAKSDLSTATANAFAFDGIESAKESLSGQYYLKNPSGELEPGTITLADFFMQNHDGGSSDTNLVFLKSGTPRQTGKDALTGKPIVFTNITYKAMSQDGNTTQKPESTMQLIEVPVHLESGKDVIFFMTGYGADGETAPDTNYPY